MTLADSSTPLRITVDEERRYVIKSLNPEYYMADETFGGAAGYLYDYGYLAMSDGTILYCQNINGPLRVKMQHGGRARVTIAREGDGPDVVTVEGKIDWVACLADFSYMLEGTR